MNFKLKNFTVSHFNNDVNNSGDLNYKYNSWSDYRKTIGKYIQDAKSSDTKSIIVFGAGKCNNLDLHLLCNNFNKIVLTDADKKSIEDGILNQQLSSEQSDKIMIEQIDYTGLHEIKFFNGLESMVKNNASQNELVSYIENNIQNICSEHMLKNYQGQFDIVLSCPVYTQLLYTQSEIFLQILNQYNLYNINDIKKIDIAFKKSMTQIVSNYNDLLLSMLKPSGELIVLTDIIEMIKKEELLNEVQNVLSQAPINIKLLEKKIMKHGLAFAKNGRKNLLKKMDVKSSFYTLWPFDEYKQYLVYGACGTKKTLLQCF